MVMIDLIIFAVVTVDFIEFIGNFYQPTCQQVLNPALSVVAMLGSFLT